MDAGAARWAGGPLVGLLAWALLALGQGGAVGAPERIEGYRRADAALLRREGWRTDLERRTVELDAIRSAGLARGAIPSLARPRFVTAGEASLADDEPVLVVRGASAARAYPLALLVVHELVEDELEGRPIAVTFCSLCATGVVWERRAAGAVLRLDVSGLLLDGNALLYDRDTESLWLQSTGACVVGERAGLRLAPLPAVTVPFGDFRASSPEGEVLHVEPRVEAGVRTPTSAHDSPAAELPLPLFEPDGRLPAQERVLVVELADGPPRAWPFAELARSGVSNTRAGEVPLVLFYASRARTPFPAVGGAERPLRGTAAAYRAELDGRVLRFERAGAGWRDQETGSRWNALGEAVAGPLAGRRLDVVRQATPFWGGLAAVRPEVAVAQP